MVQGWLEKSSKRGWQRRYFALPNHPSLLYSKTEAMERVDASIDLKLVSLVKSEGRIVILKLMQNKVINLLRLYRPLPSSLATHGSLSVQL